MSPRLMPHGLVFNSPVIAHRGSSALAPENTMASFRRAYEDGITWVETDVKLTHEGIPILMHDDTLDRTTSGHGAVADYSWNDISKLDAGSWFNDAFCQEPVPQLAPFLRSISEWGMRVNLELKPCPGRARATAMVTLIELSKVWPEDAPPPLVSSFDIESLIVAANLHPECPRGFLMDEWHNDWTSLAHDIDPRSVHVDHTVLTRDRVQQIVQNGKIALAYTVNNPNRAKDLLSWGVTAVFSDNPAAILKSL
jgi:glycerophosphoryl diester phosphodiesterase